MSGLILPDHGVCPVRHDRSASIVSSGGIVVLVDSDGAVVERWHLMGGESLFGDLVLAGVPLAFDEDFRPLVGAADCFDLSLAPAIAQVIAVTGEAPSQQVVLDEDTADLVLGWYSRNVDSCG